MAPKTLLFDLTPLLTPSGPRGIGRYIRDLARGLSDLSTEERGGIDLVGLTSLGWNGEYTTTRDLGSFEGRTERPPTERDFYRWAWTQRVALWRALRHVRADAVHVTDPHATPLLLGLTGARKIVTCYDVVPTRFPDQYFDVRDGGAFIGTRIERRRYKSADLVVAISDATREDLCTLVGVRPERVVRVYASVDTDRWARAPAGDAGATLGRFGLSGRPFALYVGGFDWRKNAEGMMGGLAHARSLGVDLDLVWAGHLAPDHIAAVEAKSREAGVTSHVRRLGLVTDEELAALYREAVCHLFVSRFEGFGLTVIEAMASGCPVLTTHGGSLKEVAGDAALTVDPEDHAAIGTALARLVREPELRADLALRGRSRATAFSRRAQAQAMIAAYRRALSP